MCEGFFRTQNKPNQHYQCACATNGSNCSGSEFKTTYGGEAITKQRAETGTLSLVYAHFNAMPGSHCAVRDCPNGTRGLKKWKEEFCRMHECNKGTSRCVCDPPYVLIPFPTERKDPERRAEWTKLINRKNTKRVKTGHQTRTAESAPGILLMDTLYHQQVKEGNGHHQNHVHLLQSKHRRD
ncbi:hypothetical protein WMY93_001503 [Mugilogobius chulae]|uniref:Uncharacterized protein n=1 Tax=Mugilogobius chulae TaxID=88201 RepID=A0AAW0QD96_9GOBI